MTVSTTTNKVAYIGNGIATSFAIPFPFLEETHLKVYQLLNNVQTERTDWTVSGGNMVFATAPANDAQIVIIREVPLTQETDYRENEILPSETLEHNFDKLTMQVQQLKEQADRAVTVDVFDDTDAASLIPSIRQAVSDCAEYASTATNKAQTAIIQAGYAEASAQAAALSEQNAANLLAGKADKNVYATKTQRGLAQWAETTVSEECPAVVIESWHNGTLWYRRWSDGWIEQSGVLYCNGVSRVNTITFPITMTGNYSVMIGYESTLVGGKADYGSVGNKTASSFQVYQYSDISINWYVCGF